MGVIPNPKMAFIFPISCILALIFPILIKYFPKCVGKGSFPKSQIKSLHKKKTDLCKLFVDRTIDFYSSIIATCRPLVKSGYQKINFLISQPKCMLCVQSRGKMPLYFKTITAVNSHYIITQTAWLSK